MKGSDYETDIIQCGVEFSADKLLYEAPCRGFNKRFMDYGVSHFNSARGVVLTLQWP